MVKLTELIIKTSPQKDIVVMRGKRGGEKGVVQIGVLIAGGNI